MKNWIIRLLEQRWVLWSLFIVNFLGTIYGFYWYKNQLMDTSPRILDIFVPDSPTASGFFTLVLLGYLCSRRSPLLEAFASITLFKYGIWAVVMIIWEGWLDPLPFTEALSWQHWMLMFSHFGMAMEGLLFVPFYTYRRREIQIVAAWTLLNDLMDYGLDLHPWLTAALEVYDDWVGLFTVLLSFTSILLFSALSMLESSRRRKNESLLSSAGK
ncbi:MULTISPECIES: DUF1405 domain-containing protein [Thermoactinomyces]|uniref:DUF1405 domain-containing protein n=1 Tax=Thermoactinomyces daqus TaxID=1329516 RepID=A0A7W1XAS1_9BACL|nr:MULTISPECIES: DUF1405 domain-containing protein [Thermoactinomyces]MBA4543159.1 DUF1405 domain-containing protein [Thermoactinomyces daqus]MBH8596605.1 DUF1405 domain-containing protein [Thermoactinomyces sp. CICC 10523]MBH8603367.1 DUF1405 domain-containing protein [Thermoactinomyces sp. CICC 10522]MBH8607866.1 DUF1405 domain-containing protein [Thermoactinomyces sp. CICC 10521]